MARQRRPKVHPLGPDKLHPEQYHAFVVIGTKPDGTPRRRHVKRATIDEVEDEIDKLLEQAKSGRVVKAGAKPTVQSWMTTYLTTVAPRRCSDNTVYDYHSKMRNWVYPKFGAKRLDQLAPDHIDTIYLDMAAAGKAPSHQLKVHRILSRALDIAERRGLVGRNVVKLVDAPSVDPVNLKALAEEVALKILATAATRHNTERWSIAFAMGLRQGEAIGLRWEDDEGTPLVELDTKQPMMHVWYQLKRQIYRHGCDGECGRKRGAECPKRSGGGLLYAKTKGKSKRDLPIPPPLVKPFKALRARQREDRMRLGNQWVAGHAVFATPEGRLLDPRDDYDEWKAILAAAGIRHVKLHIARHTAAKLLLAQGVDIRVVQELLGHRDIRTTQGYTSDVDVLLVEAMTKTILRPRRAPGKIKGSKKGSLHAVE